MLSLATIQLIPASLLLFIATAPSITQALDNPWSLGFRDFSRSKSGHESWERRDGTDDTNHIAQVPIVVRKMSNDQGEMFFPEYWQFQPESNGASQLELDRRKPIPRSLKPLENESVAKDWANASMSQPLQAPFSLHTDRQLDTQPLLSRLLRSPGAIFAHDSRDFQCPSGTSACTSINRPYSCCATGLVCQLTTDSGLGDVGCCQSGQVCGENVSGCAQGDVTCPDSLGGGCCIPGSVCDGVGCVLGTTVTSIVQPTVTQSPTSSSKSSTSSRSSSSTTSSASTTSSSSTTSSTTPAVPLTSTSTSTSTSTATTSTTSTVTSSPSPTSSTSSISTTQSTATPVVPVRPTSSAVPTTTTTSSPVTVTPSQCPTGYFQCSAYYHGGCCQVGRDCSLTSCPVASSTIAVNSDGVTVAVPSGSVGAAGGTGGCAQGWFSCPGGEGAGCCPSGYSCGTSCTATGVVVQGGATGTATVAKDNGAGRADVRRCMAFGFIGLVALLMS